MNKIKFLSIVLVLAMIFSLSACTKKDQAQAPKTDSEKTDTVEKKEEEQPKEEKKDKIEVEFWHAMSGPNGETLEKIINKFNESRDDIVINATFQGGYKDLFEKLNAAAQANQLPALTMIYGNRLSAYVKNDLVQPLDDYITDENIGFKKEIWDDIPQGLRDFGTWDGKRYALPFNKSAFLMYYNEDALKENGIEVPITWDELRAAAEKLTKDGKTGIVFNKEVGVEFSFWTEQAGGHIYDEEKEVPTIDTPENKEAYEFVTGLVKDGLAQVAVEDKHITGPMSRGEAFIGFASSSNLPYMAEACKDTGVNWNVAELPEGKKKAVSFSGTDITIFNTVSEEVRKAAFEFIKYWYEPETQIMWGKGSGYLPLTNAAANSEEFQEYLKGEGKAKQVAINQFPIAFQDPKGLGGYSIHAAMQEAFEQITTGGMSIEEALKNAQEKASKEMEEAKSNFSLK